MNKCIEVFVDRFGMLLGWRKKRERIYKKMGYEML